MIDHSAEETCGSREHVPRCPPSRDSDESFLHEIGKEREEEQFVSGMTLKFETRTATRRAFDPQRLSA
jgi:hypothetical protein